MKEPKKEDYGYEEPTLYDDGGWCIDGGEEAYHEALEAFEILNTHSECPLKCGLIYGDCLHCGKTYMHGKAIA